MSIKGDGYCVVRLEWHLVNGFLVLVFEQMGFKLGMGDLYPFVPPIRVENKNGSRLHQKLTNILSRNIQI